MCVCCDDKNYVKMRNKLRLAQSLPAFCDNNMFHIEKFLAHSPRRLDRRKFSAFNPSEDEKVLSEGGYSLMPFQSGETFIFRLSNLI